MALVIADRVQQQGSANTTVSFTLSSGVTGYQSFAVIGDGNTTYYAATDASGNWEVGVGTYSVTGPTLTRTTIVASSNSGSAVTFSGTVNVFVTYPAEDAVYANGTVLVAPSAAILPVANGGTGTSTSTGTGSVVLSNSPSLVTPALGAATANSVNIGTLPYTPANALLSAQSSVSSYNQLIMSNTNNVSATASTDFIVNNYNSTDTTYYGDFGMNGSQFSGSGAFNQPNYVYLTATTTDLALGTTTPNGIHFVINNASSDAMTINTNSAVAFNGSYGTTGQVLTSSGSGSSPTWQTASSLSKAQAIAYAMTLGF